MCEANDHLRIYIKDLLINLEVGLPVPQGSRTSSYAYTIYSLTPGPCWISMIFFEV